LGKELSRQKNDAETSEILKTGHGSYFCTTTRNRHFFIGLEDGVSYTSLLGLCACAGVGSI
jgi:hypothetical protein